MTIVLAGRPTPAELVARAAVVEAARSPQRHWTPEKDVEAIKCCIGQNDANIRRLHDLHLRQPGNLEVGLRLGRLEQHRERLQDDLAAAVARVMKKERGA